jgi:ribosome-associated protein
MELEELKAIVVAALEELKAVDLKVLDVRRIASFTDLMIIASGTSSRHVRALADKVIERCKAAGVRPLGLEGERDAEWILVDLGDIVVHVMSPAMRDYYNLEKLWSVGDQPSSSAAG